jgi:fructose-bisphosphate aldolase class II
MAIRNLNELLLEAQTNKYAVGAFNAVDSHFERAVLMAASQEQSPVILNIAEVHFDYCPPEIMIPQYKAIAEPLDIPIARNLNVFYKHRAIAHLTPSAALEMIPPANPLPSPTK